MSHMPIAVEPAIAGRTGEIVPDLVLGTRIHTGFGPAGRTVATVWATCLLLALAYPQALSSWLDDFEPNPVVDVAQSCVGRLIAVSESLGAARLSGAVRDLGKTIVRKPD
ncbi:hypothetical protein [Methylobacterium oryzae]|uniref:Protein of unassigned function n=1 Tax=Methylobacterium oryzae CBMB20 TaxID=693986 RepID=A0A089NTU9_9HYPH|nr:hypothetical protein [Methylobacterium oryzae]AIQ91356.1 protein of unassigned function [Methylobacterium oryzae CBMB20]